MKLKFGSKSQEFEADGTVKGTKVIHFLFWSKRAFIVRTNLAAPFNFWNLIFLVLQIYNLVRYL